MNLFTKRFGLVLGGVVGVGAIAALVIGATFALFNATSSPQGTTFTAGTVSFNGTSTGTCSTAITNMEPGDTGTCSINVAYNGTLPAYIGAEASATGYLANVLTFSVSGTPQTGSNPVLIGNTYAGGDGVYSATVDYALSSNADNSYQGQSAAVNVTFYAVQCSNNGENGGVLDTGADSNDNCGDAGPASWSQAAANGPDVLYNSTIDPSQYQWSMAYYATGINELGNEITFASGTGGTLNNVVVGMANFNTNAGPMDITLNIYDAGSGGLPGTLIVSDPQTFSIPSAPNGGYGSSYCQTTGASNIFCGIENFNIVFSLGSVTVPASVVYGIQFTDPQNAVDGGVNVQLSDESTNISAGTDTDPGNVFVSATSGSNDAAEVTCTHVSTTFAQFSTATLGTTTEPTGTFGPGTGAFCGMAPYVPAVQFNS